MCEGKKWEGGLLTPPPPGSYKVKGQCNVLKKIIIFFMDEIDALYEYNKIPLGHNRTNDAVYSKIYLKVEICSAHLIFDSHPTLNLRWLLLLHPNNHYNHGFPNTFDYNYYVYSDYIVCSVPAMAHIISY